MGKDWRIVKIILFLVYVGTVAYLCFGNFKTDEDLPRTLFNIPLDKIVHFLMFMPFPVLGTLAFDFRSWWRALCVNTLFANAIAFIFELFQSRINPARVTDPADLNANLLGISVGLLAAILIGIFARRK